MAVKRLTLKTPIKNLYMVGQSYSQRLKKLEIKITEDLLYHFPFRYQDFSLISPISQLQPGEKVTVQGKVVSCKNIFTKKGKKIQKAVVSDQTGQIEAVWFNQPYLTQVLKPGNMISLAGKVDLFGIKKTLTSPEFEVLKEKGGEKRTYHTGRLVAIYPETYGVSSKWLRSRIAPLVEKLVPFLTDWLPEKIKKDHQLINLQQALKQIHFPEDKKEVKQARKRLAFNELFLIQLAALKRKQQWQKTKLSHPLIIKEKEVNNFINSLPFKLTPAQKKALKEINGDLKKNKPMNRLLQGDVGSGKTVVAATALYLAFLNNQPAALMAPTEILASQHYQTLKKLFKPFKIKTALLTSSKKTKNLKDKDIFIGTHALIYNQPALTNLSLVVIDEQHRFGVEQRAKLINKGQAPHTLTMTATPIPRTIMLAFYGDLDLSVLEEMPPGRKKVKTWVVPLYKRKKAYQWIKKQIKEKKAQVFIVCPLIEESDKKLMKNIKAAEAEFKKLSTKIFPKLKLGLLHGKIKPLEKEKIIAGFKKGKIDILVSTPVVEVGIDIPQASIMVIEGAERFGLAQLHQLRGRVGRSGQQAYCLLFPSQKGKNNLKRLQAMEKHHSGFKLAEIDLKIRGPGEIYGTKQHGFIDLKIASFSDTPLVEATRKAAKKIINRLPQNPLLKKRLKNYTMKLVKPN